MTINRLRAVSGNPIKRMSLAANPRTRDGEAVETLHATFLPYPITRNEEPGNFEIMSEISPKSGSLSTIIRSYKSVVTKNARNINPCFGWQPRFYDHIIRNKNEFDRITTYYF